MDLTEDELKPLYKWIDQIPLSRPKRNIARDFSDGVLVAEVIAHFYPKLVELHNYSGANAMSPKVYNWQTLNARALKKLGFQIPREDLHGRVQLPRGRHRARLEAVQDQDGGVPGETRRRGERDRHGRQPQRRGRTGGGSDGGGGGGGREGASGDAPSAETTPRRASLSASSAGT